MSIDVRLANLDSVPLAVVRRRAQQSELSKVVRESCGVVWTFVRAHGLKAGRNVAVYLNGDIQLEVGVELDGAFAEGEEVVRSGTPAGLTASAKHFGPYQKLGTAHDAIRQWATTHGHRLLGPNWEIYGHWQPEWNTDPSLIRTDVFYLVAPTS